MVRSARARARSLVRGAIKERRDNVNDENRDVRAVGDEHRFKNSSSVDSCIRESPVHSATFNRRLIAREKDPLARRPSDRAIRQEE